MKGLSIILTMALFIVAAKLSDYVHSSEALRPSAHSEKSPLQLSHLATSYTNHAPQLTNNPS
jgi:hypothetical protein